MKIAMRVVYTKRCPSCGWTHEGFEAGPTYCPMCWDGLDELEKQEKPPEELEELYSPGERCDICGEKIVDHSRNHFTRISDLAEGHIQCLLSPKKPRPFQNCFEDCPLDRPAPDWPKITSLARRMSGLLDEIENEIEGDFNDDLYDEEIW